MFTFVVNKNKICVFNRQDSLREAYGVTAYRKVLGFPAANQIHTKFFGVNLFLNPLVIN